MDKWPLIYSRMLRKINEKNKEKLYYDIENDDIITENEIKERVEFSGNNRYRISKKYYIVGEKGLINNIYKTLNENKIPKIPEIIFFTYSISIITTKFYSFFNFVFCYYIIIFYIIV